jgi:EAL domain-containing protein (putative c-di-GMP-specific phosphodiesterase class I)
MGKSLGMQVVAEGGETVEQLDFLRKAGCHNGQGRLFGEPCSAADLGIMLKRQEAGDGPFAAYFTEAVTADPSARRA